MEWFELMKDLKEKSGMTNRLIAEKSGVPEPTLEKIFSGSTRKPGINTVIDIIHAMGGTLDSIDPVAQIKKTRKSPSTTEIALGEMDADLFDYLRNGLIAIGLIANGEDITREQAEIMIAVCRILRATFQNRQ